jgi:nicotinamidase-related amidase
LDNLYGKFFKTYRLDIVEFSPLPGRAGVQMLWRNPPGFNANSGEYVKVQIPWLSRGGSEWHPFSVYLKEQTAEGLGEVLRDQSGHQSDYNQHSQRVHFGGVASGRSVDPSTTALLLVEYQNEFASKNGKLHEGVKKVMESTNMLQNTVNLVEYARTVGTHIFHLPVVFDEDGIDNPNKNIGILKDCHHNLFFTKGTWNAEIVDCLKPKIGDIIIQNKKGLDGFMGTDLQELLEKKGIETIIIGGFLSNGCVESTMRTGYEKGYNVITLEDGSACNSHTEQVASTQFSWKMFSTPMKCAEAIEVLGGNTPRRLQATEVLGGNTPRRLQDEDSSNYATASSSEEDEEIGLRFVSKARKNAGDMDLRSFITHHHRSIMTSVHQNVNSTSHGSPVLVDVEHFIMDEAREEARSQYKTTQIFMIPAGDWTKEVYDEVYHQRQLRHCWVRGPFVSPYSIVSNFSHLVLVASGIGITPALGVMGQYKGNSRTKVLVWSTPCPTMLKFFAPLLEDAAMAIIYYTGKMKLSPREIERLTRGKKIFIQQSRPDDITSTVDTIITSIASGEMFEDNTLMEIPKKMREQWCILYCGGSQKICDMISDYSQTVDIQFHHEKFDW